MLSLEQKRWQTLWIPGLAITIMLGLLGILAYSALRTTQTSGGKPKEGRQYSGTKTAIATCDYRQTATAKVLGLLTEAGFDAFTPGGSRTDVIAVPTEEASAAVEILRKAHLSGIYIYDPLPAPRSDW